VNFYTNETHINKTSRSEASFELLKDLNPLVDVKVIKGDLTKEIL